MPKTFPRYNPLDEYPAADKNDLNSWVETVIPERRGEVITGNGPGAFPVRVPPGPAGYALAMRDDLAGLTWTPVGTPWIDVTDPQYGAVGDGIADSTTAIQ